MKNRRRNFEIHYLTCSECGNKFPIPRKFGAFREKGHIKDIWCPYCKKIQKFEENF